VEYPRRQGNPVLAAYYFYIKPFDRAALVELSNIQRISRKK